jgi:hypothetical protein
MQQHFNENYLETKRYPKAIFKGKKFDISKLVVFNRLTTLKAYNNSWKIKKMKVPAYIKKSRQTVRISYQL